MRPTKGRIKRVLLWAGSLAVALMLFCSLIILVCYPDGEPDRAILALTVGQDKRVVAARVDRMPDHHEKISFDEKRWKNRRQRIEMVGSLAEHATIVGLRT